MLVSLKTCYQTKKITGKIINKYSKTQLTYKEFEYKTKYYKLVLATTLFCNLTVNISLFLMYGCYESRGGDLH